MPRDLWLLPIATLEHGPTAIAALQARWPSDVAGPGIVNRRVLALTEGDPYAIGTYRDEWGCVFENVQAGVIGQVKHPILEDWSRLDDLRLTDNTCCRPSHLTPHATPCDASSRASIGPRAA